MKGEQFRGTATSTSMCASLRPSMAYEIFARLFQSIALRARRVPLAYWRQEYTGFQCADTANQAVSIGLKLFTRSSTAFTR